MAPTAVRTPIERGGASSAASGAELLVLVDETGAARRVLIVRDERDPRIRQVERLGFRTMATGWLFASVFRLRFPGDHHGPGAGDG